MMVYQSAKVNLGLWPKPRKEAQVDEMVQHAGPHFHVFRSKDLPERWHC